MSKIEQKIKYLAEIEKKARTIREALEQETTKSGQTYRAISYIRTRISKLDGITWRNE